MPNSINKEYVEYGQQADDNSQSNTFKHPWNVAMDERPKDTKIERNKSSNKNFS